MENILVANDETESQKGSGIAQSELQVREAEEFRRARRYKGKLHEHQDLIVSLVERGFSSYMIWKYLVEKVGVTVSENTVLRFTRVLRSTEAPKATTGKPTSQGPVGRVLPAPPNAPAPTALQNERRVSDQIRAVGGYHAAPVATPLPADGEIVRESHARAPNNADQQGTFAPTTGPTSSTIQTTDSSKTAIRPGIEKFDSSDWEHIKGVRAMKFRKSGGTGRSNTTEES